MASVVRRWDDIEPDHPIPLLSRRLVKGENQMMALVTLEPGCHVAQHSHISEQFAYILSGRAFFRLGVPGTPEYRELEATEQMVVTLPPNFPHEVEAVERTTILDVLSPAGAMGVDSQGK